METRNEKWQSLRLEAQQFVAKEYCDACWVATVECIGESDSQGHNIRYVSFPPSTTEYNLHWNGHTNHPVTYYLQVPDGFDPTTKDITELTQYIIAVHDPQSADTSANDIKIAYGRSSSGHEHYDGWGWLVGGNVHFTYDPTFRKYTTQPNHS